MKFFSRSLAIVPSILAAFSVASFAYAGPVEDRQEKMKAVGKNMGIVGKMAKGEADFDSAAALAAFVAMKDASQGFETLFPDGSNEGKTEAAPAIFTDRTGFEAKFTDFTAALDKVTAAAPADLAALQGSLGELGQTCGGCHKAYRIKKK
ncbi:MAG: c-type cytochrome [Rhizobiaceae bacterium]